MHFVTHSATVDRHQAAWMPTLGCGLRLSSFGIGAAIRIMDLLESVKARCFPDDL